MGSTFSATNLNGNHFHEILPNLYIGDRFSIYEKFFVNKQKLLVINATNDVVFNKKLNSVNIRIPVDDDLSQYSTKKLYNYLDKITDIIDKHLNDNFVILVHCVAGRQRSCAIVAAYLMKHNKMSRSDSINFIKKRRPFAFFPGTNFNKALIKFSTKF